MNTNEAWQVDAGLRFDLPFGDWTGDVYFSHGESATYNQAYGNNSLTRWRLLVTQNDYGRNADLEANQPNTSPAVSPPASAGFGGAQVALHQRLLRHDLRRRHAPVGGLPHCRA